MPCPRLLTVTIATELLPHFRSGLYNPHRSWKPHLERFSNRLIKTICSTNVTAAELATACLHLLPGLVVAAHSTHKLPVSSMLHALASFVDTVADDTDFCNRIVVYAQQLAPYVSAQLERSQERASAGNPRSIASLTRSIERLVRERRLGSAMVQVDQLQPLLSNVQSTTTPPPLSSQEVTSLLATLHPAAGPDDILSEEDLDLIQASTSIIITPADIPELLASLPDGSASGVSGWTYSAIKALYISCDASSTEKLARLLTRMLGGLLPSNLWLLARAVLIPKLAGGYRPLGIGDAWYRLAARAAIRKLGPSVGQQLSPLQNGIGVSMRASPIPA